jgi:hypothetical protein
MKKLLVLLVITLSIVFVSCGTDTKTKTSESETIKVPETKTPEVKTDNWDVTNIVDEFGDKTGEIVYSKKFYGNFTNSATQGSKLTIQVIDYGHAYLFKLYEYNRSLANICYENSFGQIQVKRANGEVEKYKAFYNENGVVFSEDGFYRVLKDSKGETMKIVIDSNSFDGAIGSNSRYVFEFTTRPI